MCRGRKPQGLAPAWGRSFQSGPPQTFPQGCFHSAASLCPLMAPSQASRGSTSQQSSGPFTHLVAGPPARPDAPVLHGTCGPLRWGCHIETRGTWPHTIMQGVHSRLPVRVRWGCGHAWGLGWCVAQAKWSADFPASPSLIRCPKVRQPANACRQNAVPRANGVALAWRIGAQ